MTVEDYAIIYLETEINIITSSGRNNSFSALSVYDKAIIYKYSEDGYQDVNERLRVSKGENLTNFGMLLAESLEKLPHYIGNVYRSVNLTSFEFERYEKAMLNDVPIVEHFFVSTSRSPLVGNQFGETRFEIFTKTGKNIENIAKYPIEKEVIIRYNCSFRVVSLDVKIIQLIEI